VWEFLVEIIPNDTTAYDNLGKLYHFTIKDFSQSESYFNQSRTINPNNINAYLGLFELYRYSYKTETNAARAILNQAIAKFPERLDLVLTLGAYERERGNMSEARSILEAGLNKARDANDVAFITAFGNELSRIPQE
jgi:tetratricopeptide (TPR) repeat protein